jgi:hypothetical protein
MSRDGPFKAGAPETTDEQGAEASSPSTRSPIVRRAQRRAAENDCDEQSEHECTVHDRRAGRRGEQGAEGSRARSQQGEPASTRSPLDRRASTRSPLDRRAQRRGGRARCKIDDGEQGEQGGAVGRKAGRGGRAEREVARDPHSTAGRRGEGREGRARCTIDDDEQGEQGGAVGRKAERQRENGAAAARPRAERASGLGNGDSGSAVGDRVSRLGLCRESSVGPALLAEGFGPFNGIGSALLALVLSNIRAAVGPTHLSCRAGPKPTGRRICPYPAR